MPYLLPVQGILANDHRLNHSFHNRFVRQGHLPSPKGFPDSANTFSGEALYNMGGSTVKIPLGISQLLIERILQNVALNARNLHGHISPSEDRLSLMIPMGTMIP